MELHASGEDYLEAVLVLRTRKGLVRSIDLVQYTGYSKPSISHAVTLLEKGGFLTRDKEGYLYLTELGAEIAEKIYERHCFFREQLLAVGVTPQTAERDACRVEHVISDESFQKIKARAQKHSADFQ